jgi:hypothetical protein
MLKTVYAIVAAAIIAACLVLAPSLSPQVEAGAPSAHGKSDRPDARLVSVVTPGPLRLPSAKPAVAAKVVRPVVASR